MKLSFHNLLRASHSLLPLLLLGSLSTQVLAADDPSFSSSSATPSIQDSWLMSVDLNFIPYIDNPVRLPKSGTCSKDFDCSSKDACDLCYNTCGSCPTTNDLYGCKDKSNWALTFQQAPTSRTGQLLNTLKSHNVTATFFVQGSHLAQYGHFIKQAYAEGHQIGSMGWSNAHLPTLTNEQIIAEFRATEEALQSLIGVTPLYVQAPHGEADRRVKSILTSMGYTMIFWNVDTLDWFYEGSGDSPNKVTETMVNAIDALSPLDHGFTQAAGHVSRQTDGLNITQKVQDNIIRSLQKKRINFVSSFSCTGKKNLPMYVAMDGVYLTGNDPSSPQENAGNTGDDNGEENEDTRPTATLDNVPSSNVIQKGQITVPASPRNQITLATPTSIPHSLHMSPPEGKMLSGDSSSQYFSAESSDSTRSSIPTSLTFGLSLALLTIGLVSW